MRYVSVSWPVISLLALSVAASTGFGQAPADELTKLLEKTRPPVRFANHAPSFSTKEETLNNGRSYWVIRDAGKIVALYDKTDGSGGQIDWITPDPTRTSPTVTLPPRYDWTTLLGERATLFAFWGQPDQVVKEEFTGGGKTLTMRVQKRWTKDRTTDATYTLVWRMDPVTGYIVDIDVQMATSAGRNKKGEPERVEYLNVQPGRMADPWPEHWNFDRTVYVDPKGQLVGWMNNLCAADRSDGNGNTVDVKEGGFVGFVHDKTTGWGRVMSHVDRGGAPSRMATCNLWEDQHHIVTLPEKPGPDGLYHARLKFRWQGVPPETVKYIEENAKLKDFGNWKEVMIRLGVDEGFEDQPLPMSTTVARGLWSWGLAVTEEKAHSGKKSLLLKVPNEQKFIAPNVYLDPNATYRLECWLDVEADAGAEAAAYITLGGGKPDPARTGKDQTDVVKAGEGWKKVTFELTTGPSGRSGNLVFVTTGKGKAYLDDFSYRKITK